MLFFIAQKSFTQTNVSYCITNAQTITLAPGVAAITPIGTGTHVLNPTIVGQSISIAIPPITTTGIIENYQATLTDNSVVILTLAVPPTLDPLVYNLSCQPGNIILPTNLAPTATVQLINPPTGLVLQNPTTGAVKLPDTGITSFNAIQFVENFNGIPGCNAQSTRQTRALISVNYQFSLISNATACAGATVPANQIIQNFSTGTPPIIALYQPNQPPIPIANNDLTFPIPVPSLIPNSQEVQTANQDWTVEMNYNGCIFKQTTNVTITQVNINLADSFFILEARHEAENDILILRANNPNALVDQLTISDPNPDTNPGFNVNFSVPTALTGNYNMNFVPNPDNYPEGYYLQIPVATVFDKRSKTIKFKNTFLGAPQACTGVPIFKEFEISFDKPAVDEVQINRVSRDNITTQNYYEEDFPCAQDPMLFTFNNPQTKTNYFLSQDQSLTNMSPLQMQTNTTFELISMPKEVSVALVAQINNPALVPFKNILRSSNKVNYFPINQFLDEALTYEPDAFCFFEKDPTNPYKYDASISGIIPPNQNQNLKNPVAHTTTNPNYEGILYEGIPNALITNAINQPFFIFYDASRLANDLLNPRNPDWVNITSADPDSLAGINYLELLRTEADYGKMEFAATKPMRYYIDETITIPANSTIPPTGVSGIPFVTTGAINTTCSFPRKTSSPRPFNTVEFYYGSRRVPDISRLLVNDQPVEICPGTTTSLQAILTPPTTKYLTSATSPNYTYINAFTPILIDGNTEPTFNNAEGINFFEGSNDPNTNQPYYDVNRLRAKYTYNYELTDILSQCTAPTKFTIPVDQTCLDATFTTHNPVETCTGTLKPSELLNFSANGLAISQDMEILDASPTFPTVVNYPASQFNSPVVQLIQSTGGISNFTLLVSVLDRTGVTYEFDVEVEVAQKQFVDFAYSPNVINVEQFFPDILQVQTSPTQFTVGGYFTSPTLTNFLDQGTGNINLYGFLQQLQVANISDLSHQITYTSPNTCFSQTQNLMIEIPTTIYNGFSPNIDGKNDVFWIDNAHFFPNLLVEIFDQNGNKVFYKKGYKNDWKGTLDVPSKSAIHLKNQLLKPGTYFYHIQKAQGFPSEKGLLFIRY